MHPEKSSRVDILELKAFMLQKIGAERFKRYFYCLDRFLNQKLSKSDFDRSCFRILGRENLPLHNHIIKSILKNACSAKSPPQIHQLGPTNPATSAGRSSTIIEDGHGQGSFRIQNQTTPIGSHGVVLPVSPKKVTSAIRDRTPRDGAYSLGPNGKADSASHQSTATEDSGGAKTVDNGDSIPCDYQRPIQHLQRLAEPPENVKKPTIKKASDVPGAILGKEKTNVPVAVEDGEEVEQGSHLHFSKSLLLAPLGIPFCSASIGGARKSMSVVNSHSFSSCVDSGVLFDSETLSKRMEQIAVSQGLHGGVTMECANLFNCMLDVYLKRLIRSCVDLVGESSSRDAMKHAAQWQHIRSKMINGLWPSNHPHMPGGDSSIMEGQRSTYNHSISLLDFKVAMELNPGQLGENWPTLMEKISVEAFEE